MGNHLVLDNGYRVGSMHTEDADSSLKTICNSVASRAFSSADYTMRSLPVLLISNHWSWLRHTSIFRGNASN